MGLIFLLGHFKGYRIDHEFTTFDYDFTTAVNWLCLILRLDICSHPRDNRLRCALRCRHSCRLRCELRCKLDVNSDVNTDVNSIKKNYIRVHI